MTPAAASDVRTWARGQGLTSAERGPLPRAVLDAYAVAHPNGAEAGPAPARRRPSRAQRRPGSARPAAAGPTAVPTTAARPIGAPSSVLEERLARVEAQLAAALARVATLEAEAPRSLLGLHVTL